jgi:hypothetical protein
MQSVQRIFPSRLKFATPQEEAIFGQYVIDQITKTRREMGWKNDREYEVNSFLWKLHRDQKKYEQDYDDRRLSGDMLFAESNIALNPILTQINQHADKLANDLLSSPQFFTLKPQGNEDANPAMEFFKERLFAVAKREKLHEKGRDAAKGAFIRGQEITMASYCYNGYIRPVARSVIALDGQTIKDADGIAVTDEQEWIANPANPDEMILEREIDREDKIRIPVVDYERVEEGNEEVIMEYVTDDQGADAKVVYYGDFFATLNVATLDEASVKGHAFRANPANLIMAYPPDQRLPEAEQYLKWCQENTMPINTGEDYHTEANVSRRRDGEDPDNCNNGTYTGNPNGYVDRAYYCAIVKYCVDGMSVPLDIYCVYDIQAQRLIHYEYAATMYPWVQGPSPHPYQVMRIWPKLSRWTGTGYYETLEVWERLADKNINRIEIDASTSGQVLFENRDATEEGIDGNGIEFRTRQAYTTRPGFTAQDALQVVTVTPVNTEIFSSLMEKFTARIELTGGSAAPQDATTSDIPGSNTLGVAKILENTANQSLRAREAEIIEGLTELLHAMADIEAWAIKQAVKKNDMAYLEAQLGTEKSLALADWLSQIGNRYRDNIEVNLSKSSSSQRAETAEAIIGILNQWASIPSPYKPLQQEPYIQLLSSMDVPDPESVLSLEKWAEADSMMAQATAQAEAEQTAVTQ